MAGPPPPPPPPPPPSHPGTSLATDGGGLPGAGAGRGGCPTCSARVAQRGPSGWQRPRPQGGAVRLLLHHGGPVQVHAPARRKRGGCTRGKMVVRGEGGGCGVVRLHGGGHVNVLSTISNTFTIHLQYIYNGHLKRYRAITGSTKPYMLCNKMWAGVLGGVGLRVGVGEGGRGGGGVCGVSVSECSGWVSARRWPTPLSCSFFDKRQACFSGHVESDAVGFGGAVW